MKIIWGMSSSFCNLQAVFEQLNTIDYEKQFVCSEVLYHEDSRFNQNQDFLNTLTSYSSLPILHTIQEVEDLTNKDFIAMVLAPCTANTLAKLVNGIYDNGLLLACKVALRNQKPIVIGYASNDGLGIGSINIAKALQMKHLYLVPLGQDNYQSKENSLVCDWKLLEKTISKALMHQQLQPLLIKGEKNDR